MVKTLRDFQNRDISTRPELGGNGVYLLGKRIFLFLREILSQNLVRGCYFSHYFKPPEIPPQVKVGIRYNTMEALDTVNNLLNNICQEESRLVLDPGGFSPTPGYIIGLPEDIVIDYIICYSFEWLVRITDEFNILLPSYETLGNYILQNRNLIEEGIFGQHIFRDEISRPLENKVISKVWERFIHHICNAYSFQQHEYQLKCFLKENNIKIL